MFVNRVADNTKNKNIIKFYLFTKYINKTSMYKLYYLKMLLQEDYDRVIGSRVRTVLDVNTLHLFFDDKFESSMNKNNPKEVIYKYNDVIQKKCNCFLSKTRPNQILLAGIGG